MHTALLFTLILVGLAFLFDFINGFHDASNSIATIVTTGVLKPLWAVGWAAFFNFIAFLVFHLKVATTIGTGLVEPSVIDAYVICAALVAAIIWNLLTWYYGLPSSSSHALIGGLVGAGLAKAGISAIEGWGVFKVVASAILSPVLGIVLGCLLMYLVSHITRRFLAANVTKWSRRLQLVSAALLSLGHGGNDAQKTMGIIAIVLFSSGLLGKDFYVPFWVVLSCNLVMALGTMAGGWRIVRTLGKKITELDSVSGACAETSAAITLIIATESGIPISTTHTVTGSIAGVGMFKGVVSTHWDVMARILWAWLLTLPVAAGLSAIVWLGISHFQ